MADIKEILQNENFGAVVDALCKDTNEYRNPREYKDEYDGGRTRRRDSVGYREPKRITIYSETEVDENGNPKKEGEKVVQVAKVVTNTPKRIVRTAVAFMFGGDMSLTATDTNDAFIEYQDIFCEKLKMHSVFRKFSRKVLSETKAAIVFFHVQKEVEGKKTSILKCKILSLPDDPNEECEFYPHFNDDDDMDAFIHKYNIYKDGVNHDCVTIYTDDKIYKAYKSGGAWTVEESPNFFKKIPVVYAEVEQPEWDDVANLMDKYEMRLSRISDTNDYFSEPILKTYGLANLPSKETVGKELNFSMEIDPDTGTSFHGDADYLSWQQSIESQKEELDRMKSEIDSGSATPDLSFNNLQKLGNLSGVARKFMLIDAMIKASMNMEVFGPVIQRCVSVVRAGMVNITHTKYASQLKDNKINVEFASVLPDDLTEELKNLEVASQFHSRELIVKNSPYTDEASLELERIKQDKKDDAANYTMPGYTL